MNDEVHQYSLGLISIVEDWLLAPETVSRKAYPREKIHRVWDGLSAEDQALVKAADRALVQAAPQVAEYWREGEVSDIRQDWPKPLAEWWWWLDKIADGSYPRELLPEWVK